MRDIVTLAVSHPVSTPAAQIQAVAEFAARHHAHLTVLCVRIMVPEIHSALADALLDVRAMTHSEQARSNADADQLVALAKSICERIGIEHEVVLDEGMISEVPYVLSTRARVRDLTVLHLGGETGLDRFIVESTIFNTGRPVLVVPQNGLGAAPIRSAVIAWDFGRAAARALSDALPLLANVPDVRLVIVRNEKDLPKSTSKEDVLGHLARRGVTAVVDEIDASGRSAANALRDYLADRPADVLVLGAFGHSRIRDFVLGGVTQAMLADPPTALLLSY
jgi:nucleotide-binding universal stress UspA family protein